MARIPIFSSTIHIRYMYVSYILFTVNYIRAFFLDRYDKTRWFVGLLYFHCSGAETTARVEN